MFELTLHMQPGEVPGDQATPGSHPAGPGADGRPKPGLATGGHQENQKRPGTAISTDNSQNAGSGSASPQNAIYSGQGRRNDASSGGSGEMVARPQRRCRVPSCSADVTQMKNYNIRYRICEQHRSAPSVMVEGLEQRFCQMCARFHDLSEFDGSKMSCRVKLEEHNLRRRAGGAANLRRLTAAASRAHNHISMSSMRSERDDGHGILAAISAVLAAAPGQLPQGGQPSTTNVGALSMQHGHTTSPQPLRLQDLPIQTYAMVLDSTSLPADEPADGLQGTSLNAGVVAQPIPFRTPNIQQDVPTTTCHNVNTQLAALLRLLGPHASSLQADAPSDATNTLTSTARLLSPEQQQSTPLSYRHTFDEATKSAEAVRYDSTMRFQRVCIKLFGCEPHELIPNVFVELDNLLKTYPGEVERHVRPGCTQVTLDITSSVAFTMQHATAIAKLMLTGMMVDRALSRAYMASVGSDWLLSLPGFILSGHISPKHCCPIAPVITHVEPACVLAGQEVVITVRGRGIARAGNTLFCRQAGKFMRLNVLQSNVYDDHDAVVVRASGFQSGRAEVEAEEQGSGILSQALPLLIVPNSTLGHHAAAELQTVSSTPDMSDLLRDAGTVTRWLDGPVGSTWRLRLSKEEVTDLSFRLASASHAIGLRRLAAFLLSAVVLETGSWQALLNGSLRDDRVALHVRNSASRQITCCDC